jgi:hypothetical protein
VPVIEDPGFVFDTTAADSREEIERIVHRFEGNLFEARHRFSKGAKKLCIADVAYSCRKEGKIETEREL